MNEIIGKYYVTDCEHEGDMRSAENFLCNIPNCKVVNTYWDNVDCGEAYVEFSFPSEKFVEIYNKLSCEDVSYNDDINKYIKAPIEKGILSNVPLMSFPNYVKKVSDLGRDIFTNINNKIYLSLMFWSEDNDISFINRVIEIIGNKTEIICYSSTLDDNKNRNYNVLFLTDITNRLFDKIDMINSIYQYSMRKNIVASLKVKSPLDYYISGKSSKYYENFDKMLNIIREKRSLLYKSPYFMYPEEVSYDKYIEGNRLKTRIVLESMRGKEFILCDSRVQFKNLSE